MATTTAHITQQIEFLNSRHLDELRLFIEFLTTKQQKETQLAIKSTTKRTKLLADIEPLAMPVSDFIIQRDTIYEDHY